MWSPLRKLGRWLSGDGPKPEKAPPEPRSLYDAAQTGSQNRNHWNTADDLGPVLSNWFTTRQILRRRARYERDNDPHFDGLAKTLAYDLIGTGPRLQLTVPVELFEEANQVTKSFAAWMRAGNIVEKLRLLIEAAPVDGETFGQFITNAAVNHPVKLDLKVMETEQIATPGHLNPAVSMGPGTDANGDPTILTTDGIEFDNSGNPTYYHVLRQHPGEGIPFGLQFDRVPAFQMVHWFRPRRPGQIRGVTQFASSLPIGAQTRRYANAVLSAAETAANIAGILKTNTPADASDSTLEVKTMEEIDIPRNSLMTVPGDWDISQLDAKQPTSSYRDFIDSKRNEMARPVMAPFNVMSGNSSGYNYSSGRLDHLPYQRYVWIERERFRVLVLDKLFLAWLEEASTRGLVPAELGPVDTWEWCWHWDGFSSIDPFKDANATEMRLQLNLTTLMEECAAEGKDWREVIDQRAIEREYMLSKGIDPDVSKTGPKQTPLDPNAPTDEPVDPNAWQDDTDLDPRPRRREAARV